MNYDSKDFVRSRRAYMLQCMLEYFVSLMVTDAFLAKLLSYIGISDALIGVISSFVTLAFAMQLLTILLVRRKINAKKTVMIFDTLSIFFFMLLYLVPFAPVTKGAKTALVMVCVILAYTGLYLIQSICYKWCNSFVKPTVRAEYSAKKEIMSLIGGMIFTAVMGYIIDRFEGLDNLSGGFLFISAMILFLNICNFICYCLISKEVEHEGDIQEGTVKSFSSVVRNTLGNRPFRKVILLSILWSCAGGFTTGFMGTFKTNDLGLTVLAVQVVNIIGCFARMLVSLPIARFSDRNSFAKGFRLALFIACVAFAVNMFTCPDRWYLVICFTVLYNCCQAGTSQNSFNITYNYVDNNYIVEAMAVKNSIAGICGFGCSIIGSRILEYVQSNGNKLFGMEIYGQQVLSAISLMLAVSAMIFVKFKIENEKRIVQ